MLEYAARLRILEQTYIVELTVDNHAEEHPVFRVTSDGTVTGVNASGNDYLSYEGSREEILRLVVETMSEVDKENLKVLL